jgi:hypothetical protein
MISTGFPEDLLGQVTKDFLHAYPLNKKVAVGDGDSFYTPTATVKSNKLKRQTNSYEPPIAASLAVIKAATPV